MRIGKRRKDVAASIEAAQKARDDANRRLADARDVIAVQGERARHEKATIIAAIKKMRESNNLGRLILDTVQREAEAGNEPGAAGDRSHE